jgi:hypothetical protein
MSWSLNMYGHVDNEAEEAAVLDVLDKAANESGAISGSVNTQFHGTVTLPRPKVSPPAIDEALTEHADSVVESMQSLEASENPHAATEEQ